MSLHPVLGGMGVRDSNRVRPCSELLHLCAQTTQAVEWKDRFVTLTDGKLYIRNDKGGDIRDTFELLDITHVKKMAEDCHTASIVRCAGLCLCMCVWACLQTARRRSRSMPDLAHFVVLPLRTTSLRRDYRWARCCIIGASLCLIHVANPSVA